MAVLKIDKPAHQAFARRLHQAMQTKGMSNSDLARAIWGETKDGKGYTVARNRHQIAVYLKGEGMPERSTLQKISELLDVPVEELAPQTQTAAIDRTRPELAMSTLSGRPEMAHLQINATLPFSLALEIVRIFQEGRVSDPPGSKVPAINGDGESASSATDHSPNRE